MRECCADCRTLSSRSVRVSRSSSARHAALAHRLQLCDLEAERGAPMYCTGSCCFNSVRHCMQLWTPSVVRGTQSQTHCICRSRVRGSSWILRSCVHYFWPSCCVASPPGITHAVVHNHQSGMSHLQDQVLSSPSLHTVATEHGTDESLTKWSTVMQEALPNNQ